MEWFRRLRTRIAGRIARHDAGAEVAEEIRLHCEERAAELEMRGMSRHAALLQARREVGSSLRAIDGARSAWHLGWIEDALTDLRYGWRGLLRDRGFAITAVVSLALGIGVNTTIFSLSAELLLSRPSVRDAASLVYVRLGGNSHAYPDEVRALRESGAVESVAGFREGELNWRASESSRRVFGFAVSANFFRDLGIPVAAGRPILPGDRDVAVLSHRFWKSSLAGDISALGRPVVLDGRPHAVIGILPEMHRSVAGFGLTPDVYVLADEQRDRLALYGRLHGGANRAEATMRIRSAAAHMDAVWPQQYYKRTEQLEVTGLGGLDMLPGRNKGAVPAFFAVLLLAVNLVLLIACINVASMLLARASARRQEIAIRASIGAGRGRIVRQLLAESLLVAALAAAAGIGLNLGLTSLMNKIQLPVPVPIQLHIEPDWRLLVYACFIALGTAAASGLLPAFQAAKFAGPSAILDRAGRQPPSGVRLRAALVGGQIAVTFVVLACAILFLRNLARSSQISPGFDTGRLVWASARLVPGKYPSPESVAALTGPALERLRTLAGVESAGTLTVVPFNDGETRGGSFFVDASSTPVRVPHAFNRVSPDYFRTMGIGLISGREFRPGDEKLRVAIVNEAFAQRVWPNSNAVGRTIRWGDGSVTTIAGLCRNTKFMTIGEDDRPALYEPYQTPTGDRRHRVEWMIRAAGSPAQLLRGVEHAILDLDPTAAVEVRPMHSAMALALLPSQVGAGLTGALGLLGIALASIGLYGVLLYGVERRRREIGVRVALGGRLGGILALVFRDTARIAGIGMAIGAGLAVFVTRPLALFLVAGLEPGDPVTLAAVGVVLGVVALAASAAPASRAARVNPAEALRSE